MFGRFFHLSLRKALFSSFVCLVAVLIAQRTLVAQKPSFTVGWSVYVADSQVVRRLMESGVANVIRRGSRLLWRLRIWECQAP